MTHNPQQLSDAELVFLFSNATPDKYEHYQSQIGVHLLFGVRNHLYIYGPIVDGVLKLERVEGYIYDPVTFNGVTIGGSIDSKFGDEVVKKSGIAVKIRAFIKQPWVVFKV